MEIDYRLNTNDATGSLDISYRLLKYVNNSKACILYNYLRNKNKYFAYNNQFTYINGNQYFFNITADISAVTMLSSLEIRAALKILIDKNLIHTEKKGVPQKRFFHLLGETYSDVILGVK